jgi:succinoglycan biosynthesis transport protein ExoP
MAEDFDSSSSLSSEDLLSVVRRRRWLIFLSVFFCWLAAWVIGWLWPKTYLSEAVLLVEQQKVPDQYVPSNVTTDLQDRLAAVTQQVLSRTRLESVIERWHLYSGSPGLWGLLHARDPIEEFREDVKIELVDLDRKDRSSGSLTAFKIFYAAESPELAQQVNKELTDLFLQDNANAEQLSESTTAFLGSQLAAARAKLEEQEAAVRDFKAQHLGDLPSQMESNVQILSGLQSQLQATQLELDRARQQKLYLDSLRQQYQSAESEDLNSQLANLRSRYTDNYPDIIALKEKIAKRDQLLNQIAAQAGAKPGAAKPSELTLQIQGQIEAVQLEIETNLKKEKQLERQIAAYQSRLNLTPGTEQQLADISRGYEESKAEYDSLLKKQSQSELAANLEKGQEGKYFKILDPPNLPSRPFAPNHFLIALKGLAAGIALGFILAALAELMDLRIRKEKDLEAFVSAQLLVGIPHISYPGEEVMAVKTRYMEIGIATAISILIVLATMYTFYKG